MAGKPIQQQSTKEPVREESQLVNFLNSINNKRIDYRDEVLNLRKMKAGPTPEPVPNENDWLISDQQKAINTAKELAANSYLNPQGSKPKLAATDLYSKELGKKDTFTKQKNTKDFMDWAKELGFIPDDKKSKLAKAAEAKAVATSVKAANDNFNGDAGFKIPNNNAFIDQLIANQNVMNDVLRDPNTTFVYQNQEYNTMTPENLAKAMEDAGYKSNPQSAVQGKPTVDIGTWTSPDGKQSPEEGVSLEDFIRVRNAYEDNQYIESLNDGYSVQGDGSSVNDLPVYDPFDTDITEEYRKRLR